MKEGKLYLACNDKNAFFTSADHYRGYHLWSFQNVCDTLSFLLDNIYIRFGTKLYRQIIGIPMGTNCAPLVADLFLFCYERDFMKNFSNDIDRRFQRQFFEVWALLGHKVPVVLSISANTPELILPCCPTDKPQIRSELGSKVIRCILL